MTSAPASPGHRTVTLQIPSVETCKEKIWNGLNLAVDAHERGNIKDLQTALSMCATYANTWEMEERSAGTNQG